MYWFLAVIFGIAWGIGGSFALMSLLLNKSNNLGDSRDDIEKYGLGVTLTTTEDFGAIGGASPIIDSYCEASMAMFTHDKSMIEFSNHKLSTVPTRPLERYIPKPEDKLADEAAKKVAEELKEEGVAFTNDPNAASKDPMSGINTAMGGAALGGAALGGAALPGILGGATARTLGKKPDPKPEVKKPEPKPAIDPIEAEIAMMFGDDLPTGEIDPEAQQFLRADAPVYEAPTASKPLWESANPDDDFSDFEEDEF